METDYLELKSKYKKLRRENRDLKSASLEQFQHLGFLHIILYRDRQLFYTLFFIEIGSFFTHYSL